MTRELKKLIKRKEEIKKEIQKTGFVPVLELISLNTKIKELTEAEA